MADMKKEMRFTARIDTGEFDRTVEQLQRRIKDIYRGTEASRTQFENRSRMAQVGMGPQVTPQDRRQAELADIRARSEYRSFIKEQQRDNDEINKKIADKVKLLEKVKKLNQDTAKIEQQIAALRGQAAGKEEGIRQALDRAEEIRKRQIDPSRMFERMLQGDIRGARKVGQVAIGRMTATERAFGAMGIAAGVGEVGAQIGAMPAQRIENVAMAARFNNEQLRRAFAGQRYEDLYYRQEMKEAGTAADFKVGGEKFRDLALIVGGVLGVVLSGGAAIPLLGGLGLAGLGAANVFRGTALGGYQAEREQVRRKAYEDLKETNFFKRYALEDLQKNMYQNLQVQRALGMSDESLRQGYIQGGKAGFVRENVRETMMGILGAGGSTRAARELAPRALELERDYGLTNVRDLMGRISGTVGGAAATEQSIIKVLEEGSKRGFDKTQFRQEMRRFGDNVAEMAYKTGAAGPTQVGALAAISGAYIPDQTMRGLEASRTAQEMTKGLDISQSGLGAAVEAGEMLSNPSLRKLSVRQMQRIQGMSGEQIMALTGPELEAMKKRTGLSEEDLKKTLLEQKLKKELASVPDVRKNLEQLTKDIESSGMTWDEASKSDLFAERVGEVTSEIGAALGPAGMETPEVQAMTRGMATKGRAVREFYQAKGVEEYRKRVAGRGRAPELDEYAPPMPEKAAETLADIQQRAAAADERAALELQRLFGEDFRNSVDDARIAAVKFAVAVSEAADMIKKGDAEGQKRLEWLMSHPQEDPSKYQDQPQATPHTNYAETKTGESL